jgi:hypothetical protein
LIFSKHILNNYLLKLLLLSLLASTAFAYSGGIGTAENPYQIATPNDLLVLAANTNDYSKAFILVNDINLAGYTFDKAVIAPDISSSENFQGTSFTGIFDGSGHSILNLTIDINENNGHSIGLFGRIGQGGLVKNLGIKDVNFIGYYSADFVGGLAGYNNGGSISNCYSTGVVSDSTYNVGGLVGYNNGGGTITDCFSSVAVTGYHYTGGLCGFNGSGSIINCYSTGSVSGYMNTGGFCGCSQDSNISGCFSTGDVSGDNFIGGLCGSINNGSIANCYSTGLVSGYDNIGGLCGSINYGSVADCYSTGLVISRDAYVNDYTGGLCGINNSGIITNCYSTGNVTVGGNGYDTGGLCGSNEGTINNCYSTGNVTASNGDNVGGLVGLNDSGCSITNCYSTGSVSGYGYSVGGLVGDNYYGTTNNSFWDVDTSGWPTSDGGTGKTTAQMKTRSTFTSAGWDFVGETANGTDDIWNINEGISYPYLTWQPHVAVPNVTGMIEADAITAITNANLVIGTITAEYSGTVPIGNVIRQNPTAGTLAAKGSTVNIVISLGLKYSGGSGTAQNPYQIANPNDLLALAAAPADYNKCFILTADIDLDPNLPGRQVFTTAIIGTENFYFTGTFDGSGHKITHLIINGGYNNYLGLFGYVGFGGLVNNLGLENCSVSGYYYVGGLAGYNDGSITSCYSTGNISGDTFTGGLCGVNEQGITDCYSTSNIIAHGYDTGGLCGYNSGNITECYSTGSVTGYHGSGGLCGYDFGIDSSKGSITNCYSTGNVSGYDRIGGLCGSINDGSITNCYSTGTVSGSSSAGGLVGYSYSSTANNSFWDVNTSGQPTSDGGTGKTTAQMKTQSTFTSAGWDFDVDWFIQTDEYPILTWQISPVDIYTDGKNNFRDFAILARFWMRNDCRGYNDYCDGADLNFDHSVDIYDLKKFMSYWLQSGIYE